MQLSPKLTVQITLAVLIFTTAFYILAVSETSEIADVEFEPQLAMPLDNKDASSANTINLLQQSGQSDSQEDSKLVNAELIAGQSSAQNEENHTGELPPAIKAFIDKENKIRQKAFGYFRKIKDFDTAFENDEYDADWSTKTLDNINNNVLFDQENSINRFSAIQVDYLDCKGQLCKLDISNNSNDEEKWSNQHSNLMHALMNLNRKSDRSIKVVWLDNGNMRLYISRGISDLD